MGILLLNIVAFSMPDSAYINPAAWGGTDPANIAVWATNFVLFDGKMRGLFSVLFGASMLLVIQRAEASEQNARSVHLNRMAWLFVIGSAHHIVLWWGDILVPYAICGTIALLFINKDAKQLIRWAIILLSLYFLLTCTLTAGGWWQSIEGLAPGADAETVATTNELLAGFGQPGSPMIAEQLDLYRGGFSGIFNENLANFPSALVNTLLFFLLDTLGLMLLGMAMLKSGFILGLWAPELYAKIARRAFAIGLGPMIALAAWVIASEYDTMVTFGAFFAFSFPFRVILTVGWAALLLWVIVRHQKSALIGRVAAAGRAAFSNYLGTSLVMTFIFYGWGLGLYGSIDRITAMVFVAGAWAIMLLWSKPWLERYRFGPAEWLWRSLARRSVQPMRLR